MYIAELERRTGVSRHTLRYYEKEGLLPEAGRGANNYREYPIMAVQRVEMLCQLKALGFSLKEIRGMFDAIRTDSIDCAEGARLMNEKKAMVDRKIDELLQVRVLLEQEQRRLEASAARQQR